MTSKERQKARNEASNSNKHFYEGACLRCKRKSIYIFVEQDLCFACEQDKLESEEKKQKKKITLLKDFKLVKNKQRPDFCYSYKQNIDDKKYEIFTMNGGKTFLASIEMLRLDGRYYSEFSQEFDSIEKCLDAFGQANF